MVVRGKFEEDLKTLQQKLLELGNFAVNALNHSLTALENKDIELALKILEDDADANILEEEINDFAILLIAKQQPVAYPQSFLMLRSKNTKRNDRVDEMGRLSLGDSEWLRLAIVRAWRGPCSAFRNGDRPSA